MSEGMENLVSFFSFPKWKGIEKKSSLSVTALFFTRRISFINSKDIKDIFLVFKNNKLIVNSDYVIIHTWSWDLWSLLYISFLMHLSILL